MKYLPSRHHVVVVDDLDEGLDLRSLSNLLLVHATSDLQGVTLDTGNNGVTIWSFLGALVVVYVARKKKKERQNARSWLLFHSRILLRKVCLNFHSHFLSPLCDTKAAGIHTANNDGLLAGVATLQNDNDLWQIANLEN